jgi:hypothetical protein
MGIDVYLEWDGMTDKDKRAQYECGLTMTGGHTGYLREAYHGGPYVTKILAREAFEADDARAQIPAEILRERLTNVTEPAYCADKGHAACEQLSQMFQSVGLMADDQQVLDGHTQPMSVEEAVRTRMKRVYPDTEDEFIEEVVQSFRDFVALAETKERETKQPCTIVASY